MKKLSIIGDLMNLHSIELFDENSIPVIIFPKSQFKFVNNFTPPSILVNNFEKRRYKDIEIRSIDLSYLNKLGHRLVSIKCTPNIRNYARQIQSYMLEPHIRPIPNSRILEKIPPEHFIEFDITNNRIRIRGKNCWPYLRGENASPWVTVIKK